MDVEERFAAVVAGFAGDPSVDPPAAMFEDCGRFVVELPAVRVVEFVRAGAGESFDSGWSSGREDRSALARGRSWRDRAEAVRRRASSCGG